MVLQGQKVVFSFGPFLFLKKIFSFLIVLVCVFSETCLRNAQEKCQKTGGHFGQEGEQFISQGFGSVFWVCWQGLGVFHFSEPGQLSFGVVPGFSFNFIGRAV